VFAEAVGKGGIVKALNAKGCAEISRKEIDDLTAFVASTAQGHGLDQGARGRLAVAYREVLHRRREKRHGGAHRMQTGDLVFFVADQAAVVNDAWPAAQPPGAEARTDRCEPVRFPLGDAVSDVRYDEPRRRYQALHHPFTAPVEEDYDRLETNPLQ